MKNIKNPTLIIAKILGFLIGIVIILMILKFTIVISLPWIAVLSPVIVLFTLMCIAACLFLLLGLDI